MYALIREVTVKPESQDQLQSAMEEFNTTLGQQPGFRGLLGIDAGNDRRVMVLLWDDIAAQQTAGPTLGPAAARLIGSHVTGPGTITYEGPVIVDAIRTR